MKDVIKNTVRLLVLLIAVPMLICLISGCNDGNGDETDVTTYKIISAEEAKTLMETEEGYIILDVRNEDEFEAGHIPGAILIPYNEIAYSAESVIPDKNKLILVYCRSGRRSKIASEMLVMLGYTNVKEFGGIIDWPYETEQ